MISYLRFHQALKAYTNVFGRARNINFAITTKPPNRENRESSNLDKKFLLGPQTLLNILQTALRQMLKVL